LDDIEPGLYDILLDAAILSEVTPEEQSKNSSEYLEDDLNRKYERMRRLDDDNG